MAMAPERAIHTRVKAQLWLALRQAIDAAGLPCEAFTDGLSVRIADDLVYEPDALVRCGERLDDDALVIVDPVVVVEVLSPSTRGRDAGAKLEDYFRLPSVRHYLIVKTDSRSVIHHRRGESEGELLTRVTAVGELVLDPPGLSLPVDSVFAS